jgi:hypothetical protein
MYVACTTETCSAKVKDESIATARKNHHRHLDRIPLTHKSVYPIYKEFIQLLPKSLCHS